METFIEPMDKAPSKIQFAWNPEPETGVTGYKVYVGQIPAASSLTVLASNVSARVCTDPVCRGKVTYDALIADVRTLLGISTDFDFSNLLLYWAITYLDSAGTESSIADSRVVTVPPVGILGKLMKEDPSINRHLFGFSDFDQRWIKAAASNMGALIVDNNDYYKSNITTEYTYDGTNVSTVKAYRSDMTTAGSPAKLTTYEYSGSDVTKITVTDSTV